MSFTAILGWNEDGRPDPGYRDGFASLSEAQAHVDAYAPGVGEAIATPAGSWAQWQRQPDGEWVQTPRAASAAHRDIEKASFVAYLEILTRGLTGPVSDDERASWSDKKIAARAYLTAISGGATDAEARAALDPDSRSMLEAEIALSGESLSELCAVVVSRSAQYSSTIGAVASVRKATLAAIDALPAGATRADIAAVANAGQAQIEAALAAQS